MIKKNVNVCKNASLVIPWYNVHGLGMKSTIQNTACWSLENNIPLSLTCKFVQFSVDIDFFLIRRKHTFAIYRFSHVFILHLKYEQLTNPVLTLLAVCFV